MEFQQLLRFAVEHNASDIHLQAGLPPHLRMGGHLKAVNQPPITDEALRSFIGSIAPAHVRANLGERIVEGLDFSYAASGLCRFRCSAYQHLSQSGISMRVIKNKIPSIAELHLPEVVGEIANSQRGLTLRTD